MLAMYPYLASETIDEQERATLGEAASKLFRAIDDGKYVEAKKQAESLKNLKPNPKAKLGTFPKVFVEIEDVMHQFRPIKQKGLEIEVKLIKLLLASEKNNKVLPAQEMNEELLLLVYQTVVAAELTAAHKP